MLSVHITKGISETPDAAKAVLAELSSISECFKGIDSVVGGMSPEGQRRVIVDTARFLKARASYYAAMKRLGLDDGPQAA